MVAEQGSVGNDSVYGDDGGDDDDDDDDDDEDDYDDWEGVESTELDETFSAATAFVAAAAADRVSEKVSNELQLKLYGFYKIATEGPCSTPQPSALKMTARAKWYRMSFFALSLSLFLIVFGCVSLICVNGSCGFYVECECD